MLIVEFWSDRVVKMRNVEADKMNVGLIRNLNIFHSMRALLKTLGATMISWLLLL